MNGGLIINSMILFVGNRAEDVITPSRDAVFAVEGQNVTLSCNYTVSADSLHWYRQYSGSPPQFLILDYAGTTINAQPPVPGIFIIHHKGIKKVDLIISSTAVSDSALYYCALRPTVTGNPPNTVLNLLL
uniref:Ig-like domain-containing protein n=1 Tax=Astyanax mexicanus TaxID=7994 RepID=A0A3B1ICN2_ASTMX